MISDDSRDYRKFTDRATREPKKRRTRTVSRSGNGIGNSASMQERITLKAIRLSQLHEKIIKI
jgi:hypothetical protein